MSPNTFKNRIRARSRLAVGSPAVEEMGTGRGSFGDNQSVPGLDHGDGFTTL